MHAIYRDEYHDMPFELNIKIKTPQTCKIPCGCASSTVLSRRKLYAKAIPLPCDHIPVDNRTAAFHNILEAFTISAQIFTSNYLY